MANVNNVSPIGNPLRPFRSLSSMNNIRSFNGPALDMRVGPVENNDVPGTIPLACFQPLLEGRGQANLTRYYFSSKTRTCEEFTYTGKGGNQVVSSVSFCGITVTFAHLF